MSLANGRARIWTQENEKINWLFLSRGNFFFFSEVGVGDTTVPEKRDLKRESRKGSLVGAVNPPTPGSAGHRGSPMTMNWVEREGMSEASQIVSPNKICPGFVPVNPSHRPATCTCILQPQEFGKLGGWFPPFSLWSLKSWFSQHWLCLGLSLHGFYRRCCPGR